jgi:hypothetical protein
LVKVPVEPLLMATERAALALAAPEFLLVLLSFALEVSVLVLLLLLMSVLTFVVVGALVFVSVLVAVLVLLPTTVAWSTSLVVANAAPLKPNATAMAEAKSDFFMIPPEVD